MAQRQEMPNETAGQVWPQDGLTRIPYRVFQTDEAYKAEQKADLPGAELALPCA